MSIENDHGKIVPFRAQRDDPPTESRLNGDIQNDVVRIETIRNELRTVTRDLRLGTAAQMIAAARELIDGEPGYLDDCRFLDELQVQLQSDSV